MQEIKIGRNPENDIVFDDTSVSRIHASIIIEGNSKFIIDHNSGNGTFVNGNKIFGKTVLNDNDIVKVGNSLVHWMAKLGMLQSGNNVKTNIIDNSDLLDQVTVVNHGKIVLPGSGAALTLGILSIIFCGGVGIILGIIGIVQANKGEKLLKLNPTMYTEKSINQSKSGKICSIVGLSLVGVIILIAALSTL